MDERLQYLVCAISGPRDVECLTDEYCKSCQYFCDDSESGAINRFRIAVQSRCTILLYCTAPHASARAIFRGPELLLAGQHQLRHPTALPGHPLLLFIHTGRLAS